MVVGRMCALEVAVVLIACAGSGAQHCLLFVFWSGRIPPNHLLVWAVEIEVCGDPHLFRGGRQLDHVWGVSSRMRLPVTFAQANQGPRSTKGEWTAQHHRSDNQRHQVQVMIGAAASWSKEKGGWQQADHLTDHYISNHSVLRGHGGLAPSNCGRAPPDGNCVLNRGGARSGCF